MTPKMLEMFTMCARFSRFNTGRKNFTPYTVPQKLIFISERKSSSETSSKSPCRATPALLISRVTRACLLLTSSANDRTPASSATSTKCVLTSALFFSSDCAVCRSPASSTSASASAEPAAASCCARARPMPDPAPVTTAIPSLKNDMGKPQGAAAYISQKAGTQPHASFFHAMDEQRAFGLERAQLLRVAEPPPRVDLRRWGAIHDALVHYVRESRSTEQSAPFLGGQKMRGHREETSPLVAVRIVAIVVDQDPRRAPVAENPKNILDAGGGIGPVIRRFDGNRMREKVRLPGDLGNFTRDKHQIVEVHAASPRVTDHFVRNIHPHHAALGHQFRQPPRKPPRPATYIQDIVRWSKPHFLQHRQRDRQVLLLHSFAPPGLRPAVKFLS